MADQPTETPDEDDRPDNIDTRLPPAVIVYRKPGDLVPYPQNAKTHEPEQIQRIARSIQQFGFTNPVLVRGDDILAGHARCLAAEYMNIEVPTIDLAHLTDEQAQAYVLADNRLAELSEWDFATLAVEFDDLVAQGFDVELTGFTQRDRDAWATMDRDDDVPDTSGSGGDGFHCPTCGQFINQDFN